MAHNALLSWSPAADATPASTYNVYRANGVCPASGLGSLTFEKLNNLGISGTSYDDTTVAVGQAYCFYATQVQGSSESAPSNTAGGTVVPNGITIQLVLS